MKIGFSRKIKKHSYVKFNKNPSSGNQIISRGQKKGQTGGHYEANIRFSQFWESAHKGYSYMMMQGTHLGSQDSS
jgi:hypothetical protein